MAFENQATVQTGVSQLETHKVIRNTYMMLSLTLLFSALMATVSLLAGVPGWTSLLTLGGALVLVWFVLPRTATRPPASGWCSPSPACWVSAWARC